MAAIRTVSRWLFGYVGSTRSAGLMRIGLALMIWYRFFWMGRMNLYHQHGVVWLLLLEVSTFCMLIGYHSRLFSLISGALALTTYYYFYHYLHDLTWAHHHTYFIGFDAVLLSLAPCGGSYSLDRFLATQRAAHQSAPPPYEEGNLLGMRLLAVQLAALYFFAFWDKAFIADTNDVFYSFLDGSRLQSIFIVAYSGSDFVFQPWMSTLGAISSISVAALELVLPLMLFQRFQKWLFIPGMILHLFFYLMLPLDTYSLTCMILYLAFFDANKVHGLIDLLGPSDPPEPAKIPAHRQYRQATLALSRKR